LRLVKEGAKLAVDDYTVDLPWRPVPFSATADVGQVLAEFEEGATIVLQGLHLHWERLAVFCRQLERELEHPAQANAYFTPRDSQGLAVHHDTHDVFVLQVAGEKRWLVYEPVWPLPLKDQRYKRELGPPGEIVHDITLRPGDTLYLPRGWLHEAVTSATDSLHVTVGINVYSWLDAFKAALKECAYDVAFRRTPDHGDPDELVERLRERLSPDDVARRRRERFVKTRRPILGNQLSQLRALDGLGPETLVERRPTVVADLGDTKDGLALAFEGKELTFPPAARSDVEFVAQAEGPFRPSDLPGELNDRSRLILVRRLVREGFLRLSEPDGPSRRSDGPAEA
jgi:bifunctional lysine-specific demethylase and histidyl-hydroxylase NO66